MVKNKDRWSSLSMSEKDALFKIYVSNGITFLDDIKKDYNSFAPGGPIEVDEYGYPADITPAVVEADYPRENEVWKRADASNADMVQRLKQGSSRVTIPDWEDTRRVATHKMMSAGKYAVGNVQNINGQLFDFTDPKHGFENPDRAAIDSAIERGDYIKFDTEGDARYFAEHYKKHYNSFGEGGDTEGDNNDSTTPERKLTLEEFLQAKADSTRVAALESSRNRTEGIEIVYPLSELSKEINRRNLMEYYYADPNFIGPILEYQNHRHDRTAWYQAKKELDNNCDYGLNCIGTATDNYPEDSREIVNKTFRENPANYGFVGVPYDNVLPGDIVQVGDHGMIFDSFAGDIPLFNYSNGSIGPDAYVKQGQYPADYYSVFRYVGTPTLIQQWTEEYNAQNKKFGGKLNRFDIGGPTREMTPLEAAALNKTLNQSQYMLAVGDSPNDPAYLSTDVLEPAVVKAFSSEEDYNRYQGEKFGEYVSNEISEAGTKLAPVLVGAAAAPWAISGGIAAYTNPITRSIIDLAGSIDGIRNAASKNGVRKTIKLAKEGDVWGTTKSAVGDIFDIAGGIGAVGDVYRYGKGAAKRLAESVVRIGDMAANSSFLKQQLLNKNAINYILNPFADPNLAYQLPYKYSGEGPQSEASMHAHYGDVVDQYFRKVSVPNTLSKTDVTPGMKHYIETHYPGRDVAYVDLGELKTRPRVFEPTYDLLDGETYKSGLELATLLTVDGKRLDPGGFNYIGTRKGNDLVGTGYDIWKFNAEDYVKKYPGHMNIGVGNKKLKNIIKRFDLNRMIPYYGLKFIDKMGDPVVYKFTHTTPDYYKSIDAFENGGKINRFDSSRKLLTKRK